MPELPEVETIRRGLEERIVGESAGRVLKVRIFEKKSFIGNSEEVVGKKIVKLRRRGKALILDFSGGVSLMVHLRMTGQLVWWKELGKNFESDNLEVRDEENLFAGGHPSEDWLSELPNKHTRVELDFEKGKLFFNDQRKFGFMKIIATKKIDDDAFVRKLGKEPWEMTKEELYEKLQRRKGSAIKAILLDQTVMAGLGNIYADETLYFSGISPLRKAGDVNLEEAEELVNGARIVMERSLAAGGSTIRNYVKSDGTRGDYLDLFAKVYGREGKNCEKCGEKIIKLKLGGRGTHYCPRCQK